ncbi:MAG: dethiobiotin synthase [Cytophagales bacterium]|nr:dethiobiotin synthase [Cytophagales bacterium]
MNYFVTAIGTDSGKTLVSAILTEMLGCGYWKPIQAGEPRDTDTVKSLVTNSECHFISEKFLLKTPASPHYSAEMDGIELSADKFELPSADQLIIEGAGGLLVPINSKEVIADLIRGFNAEVILVSDLYLGSINHTLLTVEELKRRKLAVKGIMFNGDSNVASEKIILQKSGYRCLMRLPKLEVVDSPSVIKFANELRRNWE